MTKFKILLLSLTACLPIAALKAQTHSPVMATYGNAYIDSLICACSSVQSKDATPPAELQQKFRKDFPKAFDVEWEMAGNVYEVEFEIRFTDYKAFYDAKGNLLMYGCDTKASNLPGVVKSAAEKLYPKYRFDDVKKVRKGSETFYKIEMERRGSEAKMVIKQDGTTVEKWCD
ncbi:hypothetical protein FACS1894176_06110 [Bacteroidia bacterium]|nr:hypothetical protein FACS1894176_06110 [Bacteroidia bacterium]